MKKMRKKGSFDICLTTYDALRHAPGIITKRWNYIVFDEAHKLKNADTNVFNMTL